MALKRFNEFLNEREEIDPAEAGKKQVNYEHQSVSESIMLLQATLEDLTNKLVKGPNGGLMIELTKPTS